MPVYVYRNLVTKETFEYQQRITEDALTVDPRTGDSVRRVIQPVGIAFKGSGFYVNDSRSGSSAASSASADRAKAGETTSAATSEAGSGTSSPSSNGEPATAGSGGASDSTPNTSTAANDKKSGPAPAASAG
ncbi:MAG TPA: hypothetical protein VFD39_13640 [Trueperaceae bacterium]|nr:hypothetical protein [Trueperaceae bacterium]